MKPSAYDVLCLGPNGSGISGIENLFILTKFRDVQRADARVHPSVKGALLTGEFRSATFFALFKGWSFLPGAIVSAGCRQVWRLASVAVPYWNFGAVEPTSRDRPVDCDRVEPVQQDLPVHVGVEL